MKQPRDDRTWFGRLCSAWGFVGFGFAWGLTYWHGVDNFYWNGGLFLFLVLYDVLFHIWDQLRQQTALMWEEDHFVIEIQNGTSQPENLL